MRRRNSLPLLLCLAASSEAPPRAERRLAAHSYQEVALTAADAAADDRFGWSVAIDGDTVVVGAYRKGDYTGAAYVYRTTDGGAAYGQVAKLTASDAAGATGSATPWQSPTALLWSGPSALAPAAQPTSSVRARASRPRRTGSAGPPSSRRVCRKAAATLGSPALTARAAGATPMRRVTIAPGQDFGRPQATPPATPERVARGCARRDGDGRPVQPGGKIAATTGHERPIWPLRGPRRRHYRGRAFGDDDGGTNSGSAYVPHDDGGATYGRVANDGADAAQDWFGPGGHRRRHHRGWSREGRFTGDLRLPYGDGGATPRWPG